MARKHQGSVSRDERVLVIDDNAEYLTATERLLARAGYHTLVASDGAQGLACVREHRVDVVLVDYWMPGMTGEQFVSELRTFDDTVQVVLQTGYAQEHPPREMLRRLAITGYHDKSDGPEKLLLWTEVGIKAGAAIRKLEQSRRGLRYILEVTPEMHRAQPLAELLQGILTQTAGLLGVIDSFVAVLSGPSGRSELEHGFLATMDERNDLVVRAGTGRFAPGQSFGSVDQEALLALVRASLDSGCPVAGPGALTLPLRAGSTQLGVVHLEGAISSQPDLELVQLFANQASVALHNAELYDMAAVDALTDVFTRRFFEHSLMRDLRTSHRSRQPMSLLLVDVDEFKAINDGVGHLEGDRALADVAQALREATRATDVVGRYGADEFAVVLPGTDAEGSLVVAERILRALGELSVGDGARRMPVRASLGLATLEPASIDESPRSFLTAADFDDLRAALFRHADTSLYDAKRQGRARLGTPVSFTWPASEPCAAESRHAPPPHAAAAGSIRRHDEVRTPA